MRYEFDPSVWGTVGQWVAAVATSSAVAVALFKDEFLRLRRRPQLRLTAELKPPHCVKTFLGPIMVQKTAMTIVTAECYFLRLWITNEGRTRADQVQVFLGRLFRGATGGSFVEIPSFLPMNLRWSQSQPDKSPEIYASGISPGMGRHCDFLRIVHPKNRRDVGDDLGDVPIDAPVGALQLEVFPNTGAHLLKPGIYRLDLKVAAANCRPTTSTLELNQLGAWFDDESSMFRGGVELRVV